MAFSTGAHPDEKPVPHLRRPDLCETRSLCWRKPDSNFFPLGIRNLSEVAEPRGNQWRARTESFSVAGLIVRIHLPPAASLLRTQTDRSCTTSATTRPRLAVLRLFSGGEDPRFCRFLAARRDRFGNERNRFCRSRRASAACPPRARPGGATIGRAVSRAELATSIATRRGV